MPFRLEWVDTQADRTLERQRAKTDNAKLIAVFVAGIPAALFATALQVNRPVQPIDHETWPWVVATVVLAVLVALLDRIREVDHGRLLDAAALGGWTEDQFVWQLRKQTLEILYANEWFVRVQLFALGLQVAAAFHAGNLAATSLLT